MQDWINLRLRLLAKHDFGILLKIFISATIMRARSLVVSDLRSETKGSRFEYVC